MEIKKRSHQESPVTYKGIDHHDHQPAPKRRRVKNKQEISILNGILEFSSQTGLDPSLNTIEFFSFMRENLSDRYSEKRLTAKVMKLRRKYEKNIRKMKVISSPHEIKVFEMSKKIWGVTEAVVVDKTMECMNEISFLNEKLSGKGDDVILEAMNIVGETKRKEIEKEWKEYQVMELEACLKRAQFVEYATNMFIEVAKAFDVSAGGK